MTRPETPAPLLDASVRIDNIPTEGRDLDVVATAAQKQAIAARLQISAVEELRARLHVSRLRAGMRVEGIVEAVTVQPCVVTFVPVVQEMAEPIDRLFLPAAEQPKSATSHPEVFVDLETEDEPDYFDGHEVDLSEAIVEAVALGLDPYPRAPGAALPAEAIDEDEDDSPFAGLKSLLDDDGEDDGKH